MRFSVLSRRSGDCVALLCAVFLAVFIVNHPPAAAGEATAPDCAGCQPPFPAVNVKHRMPYLDANDELAALESVHVALSEVADGSSYVWHRSHGRLSGLVRPVRSFKDAAGRVCRYVFIMLNGLEGAERTEGIACRLPSGIWQLDG